jgi:hypothetical protein
MRHKTLSLPGQLPLNLDATGEELGDIEAAANWLRSGGTEP